jgi:hypothetical protein
VFKEVANSFIQLGGVFLKSFYYIDSSVATNLSLGIGKLDLFSRKVILVNLKLVLYLRELIAKFYYSPISKN